MDGGSGLFCMDGWLQREEWVGGSENNLYTNTTDRRELCNNFRSEMHTRAQYTFFEAPND